ncbi:MAG: ion channel activity [Lichina confinis]|nr:MAG: ion channel activity [Lichina confinis]
MGNEALEVNPSFGADIHITTNGSNWLWAVAALFAVAALAFFGLAFTRPRTHRLPYYIASAITLVTAINFFTQASNLGWTGVPVRYQRSNPKVRGVVRQVFYTRYIDWFITAPLAVLLLLLTAAVPWATIIFTIFLVEVVVVCGLVGALVRTSYKWGYFAFGLAALFAVLYHVFVTGRKHTRPLGNDVGRSYTLPAAILGFTALLYPIAWGLSEGGNVIAPDSEAVFYGVLDIVSKLGLLGALVFGLRKLEPGRTKLRIREYDDPAYGSHFTAGAKDKHHNNGVHQPAATTTV